MPGPFRRAGISVVLVASLLTGCASNAAAQRVQSYFGLRDVGSEEAIRSGLLEKVPIGTVEIGIMAFLNTGQIGKDGLSDVRPFDESTRRLWAGLDGVYCDVRLDPTTMGFVKEEYSIYFVLDDMRKLVEIRVDKTLTGL